MKISTGSAQNGGLEFDFMKPVKYTFFNLFLVISLILSPVTVSLASMNMPSFEQSFSDSQNSSPCHDAGKTQNAAEFQKQIARNVDLCDWCIHCHCPGHAGCHHCNGFSTPSVITTNILLFSLNSHITYAVSFQKGFSSLTITPDSPPPIA